MSHGVDIDDNLSDSSESVDEDAVIVVNEKQGIIEVHVDSNSVLLTTEKKNSPYPVGQIQRLAKIGSGKIGSCQLVTHSG